MLVVATIFCFLVFCGEEVDGGDFLLADEPET